VLADLFVPGSPPLLPGDAVGVEKVNKWREYLVQSLHVVEQVSEDTSLGCDFCFAIEPERVQTSDLDNFCVPAAQALGYALFGDVNQARRLVDLHAIKAAADVSNPLGTRVQVWAE